MPVLYFGYCGGLFEPGPGPEQSKLILFTGITFDGKMCQLSSVYFPLRVFQDLKIQEKHRPYQFDIAGFSETCIKEMLLEKGS